MIYPTSLPLNPLLRKAWHGRHKDGKKVFASFGTGFPQWRGNLAHLEPDGSGLRPYALLVTASAFSFRPDCEQTVISYVPPSMILNNGRRSPLSFVRQSADMRRLLTINPEHQYMLFFTGLLCYGVVYVSTSFNRACLATTTTCDGIEETFAIHY